MTELVLVGRSSSHFTRVARFFALELEVPHTFRPLLDLTTLDPASYADNPALKIPVLVDEDGSLFGVENICRSLARRESRGPNGQQTNVVLRGDLSDRIVANAEELVLHVMSAEVSAIMTKLAGGISPSKLMRSMESCLRWLDENVDPLLAALPSERALSFVEVALFCLFEHLSFREVMDVSPWRRLARFSDAFGQREAARRTEYRYDAA